jgi:hypothetical protein
MADNTHHLSKPTAKTPRYSDEGTKGPVPMHHRLKLGIPGDELQKNPFGAGEPSHKSTIRNGGKRGW